MMFLRLLYLTALAAATTTGYVTAGWIGTPSLKSRSDAAHSLPPPVVLTGLGHNEGVPSLSSHNPERSKSQGDNEPPVYKLEEAIPSGISISHLTPVNPSRPKTLNSNSDNVFRSHKPERLSRILPRQSVPSKASPPLSASSRLSENKSKITTLQPRLSGVTNPQTNAASDYDGIHQLYQKTRSKRSLVNKTEATLGTNIVPSSSQHSNISSSSSNRNNPRKPRFFLIRELPKGKINQSKSQQENTLSNSLRTPKITKTLSKVSTLHKTSEYNSSTTELDHYEVTSSEIQNITNNALTNNLGKRIPKRDRIGPKFYLIRNPLVKNNSNIIEQNRTINTSQLNNINVLRTTSPKQSSLKSKVRNVIQAEINSDEDKRLPKSPKIPKPNLENTNAAIKNDLTNPEDLTNTSEVQETSNSNSIPLNDDREGINTIGLAVENNIATPRLKLSNRSPVTRSGLSNTDDSDDLNTTEVPTPEDSNSIILENGGEERNNNGTAVQNNDIDDKGIESGANKPSGNNTDTSPTRVFHSANGGEAVKSVARRKSVRRTKKIIRRKTVKRRKSTAKILKKTVTTQKILQAQ